MERQGITFTFAGETVEFDRSVDGCKKGLSALRSEYKILRDEFKKSPDMKSFSSLLTNLRDKEKLLNEQLDLYKQRLDEISNSGTPRSEEWVALRKRITDTEYQLQRVKGDIDELTRRSASVEVLAQKFDNISKSLDKTAQAMNKVGNALKPLSAIAALGLGASAKSAIDFENAMVSVQKTVDETDTTKYEDLADAFKEMSKVVPSTASDIAEVAAIGGQLGVSADNLAVFTKAVIDLSNSTNLLGEEAATMLAQTFNITGSDIANIDRFAAALVELGNNSATTERDILEMANRLAAATSTAGMSEQELLALATTLSSVGLKAENAGSSLSTIIRKISTYVASGEGKLEEFAELIDVTTEEFQKMWNEDSYSTMQRVIGALGDATKENGKLFTTLEDLNISSIRQTDTMTRLARASELLTDMSEMSNRAWDENVALTDEANKRYNATASRLKILVNNFQNLAIQIGDRVIPYLNQFIDFIIGLTDKMSVMNESVAGFIALILAIVAALSPLFLIGTKIVTLISGLVQGAKLLLIALTPAEAAIATIVAVFALCWTQSERLREAVANLAMVIWDLLVKAFQSLMAFINPIWETLKDRLLPIFGQLGDIIGHVFEIATEIFAWIGDNVFPIIEGLATGIGTTLAGSIQYLLDIIEAGMAILSGFVDMIHGIIDLIANATNSVVGFFSKIANRNVKSGAFGDLAMAGMSSGGFSSGGINVTSNITVNTNNQITANDVRGWGKILADSINDELGRRL